MKFIDGSDPSTLGQARAEKIDLHVARSDDEDIVNPDRAGPPLSVDPTLGHTSSQTRGKFAVDSPLEGTGFELTVPP